MKSQDQQPQAANRKSLDGDTGAESDQGREKKRREQFAGWLGESPGVQIISFASHAAAVLSVIVAAITYYAEAPQRTKEKHYQAWQAINTAHGQGGSGGRIEALQDLNEDDQSLVGLSIANAFLEEVNLAGAELDNADFQGARLSGADLRGASLRNADLQDAYFGDSDSDDARKANLRGAHFEEADARGANLSGVDLQGAKFNGADLNGAVLSEAQLQVANLKNTVLENADLTGANLQEADFEDADLYYADLHGANLRGAKNLTQEQIDGAFGDHETQLPQGLHAPSGWEGYSGQLGEAGPLAPGDYSTTWFDAPMSFKLSEGWELASGETDTQVELIQPGTNLGILFTAPKRVYDPHNISSAKISPVPENTFAWLHNHPYLHASEPDEVVIGGVTGKQFDVQIPTLPDDYPLELCEGPCLPLIVDDPFEIPLRLYEGGYRVIVLTVQGHTVARQPVVIIYDLEEIIPAKAEEVLNTIEWEGV